MTAVERVLRQAMREVERKTARTIIEAMKAKGRTPITDRQKQVLHAVRRKIASGEEEYLDLHDAIEDYDGRVLPGLFIRGLVRWNVKGGNVVLEQKEPGDD